METVTSSSSSSSSGLVSAQDPISSPAVIPESEAAEEKEDSEGESLNAGVKERNRKPAANATSEPAVADLGTSSSSTSPAPPNELHMRLYQKP